MHIYIYTRNNQRLLRTHAPSQKKKKKTSQKSIEIRTPSFSAILIHLFIDRRLRAQCINRSVSLSLSILLFLLSFVRAFDFRLSLSLPRARSFQAAWRRRYTTIGIAETVVACTAVQLAGRKKDGEVDAAHGRIMHKYTPLSLSLSLSLWPSLGERALCPHCKY